MNTLVPRLNPNASAQFLRAFYAEHGFKVPDLHIVLGSGLSSAFETSAVAKDWEQVGQLRFGEIPGVSDSTAPGHKGVFRYYRHLQHGGVVCFQVGRLHGYEGLHPREVVLPVVAAGLAGTQNFLLTNASGSLKKNFKTGSIMIIKDHVNLSGATPLWGPNPENGNGIALGPRFPDMSAVWDEKLNGRLKKLLKARRFAVNEGLYLGLSGPAYETPAEVKLFSSWGLGAVGMSTVWEAQAIRHMGLTLGGLSFISNMGCGLVKKVALNHEDVEKEGRKIALKLVEALFVFADHESMPKPSRLKLVPTKRKGKK